MNAKEIVTNSQAGVKNLAGDNPQFVQAFMGVVAKAEAGEIDIKTKEFICIALGIAARCEPCMAIHIQAGIEAGLTKKELSEVCALTAMMGGGPGLMYSGKAMKMYDELSQ